MTTRGNRRRDVLTEVNSNVPSLPESKTLDGKAVVLNSKPAVMKTAKIAKTTKTVKTAKTTKSSKNKASIRDTQELKAVINENEVLKARNEGLMAQIAARNRREEEKEAQIAALTEALSKSKIELEAKPALNSAPVAMKNPFGGDFPANYIPKTAGPPPPRPPQAFKFYSAANRDNVKAQMRDATLLDVNSELRELWNNLGDNDRAPYEARANEAQALYEEEKALYEEKRQNVERTNRAVMEMHQDKKMEAGLRLYEEEMAKRAAKKGESSTTCGILSLQKPKQPRTAWNYYMMQKRAELKSADKAQPTLRILNTQMSESWNKLQSSKKKADKNLLESIHDRVGEDKKRYEDEMAEYNAQVAEMRKKADAEFEEMEKIALEQYMAKEQNEAMVKEGKKLQAEKEKALKEEKRLVREKKKAAREAKAALPKAARSAYIFFVMENRNAVVEECEGLKNTEVMAELGKRWKLVSEQDKQKYVEMAANDRVRYENEKQEMAIKA